jgi:TatD DNase family protein
MLIDTHAHLQMKDYNHDRGEVIARASEAGVGYIINASFDLPSSQQAVELAEKHENFYAAVGFHPHDAKMLDDKALDVLRILAKHPKVVAIGEMGLDYYRDLSPRAIQKSVFEMQLQLAQEIGLPVIVHNRDAHDDTLGILQKYTDRIQGVMHCFSGDQVFADKCLKMGFYISFAGTVTYPNARILQGIAAYIPSDKFFIETDCPYLAPQFKRGKRNEPSYIKAIAKRISELRHTTLPEISRITTLNAKELFRIE